MTAEPAEWYYLIHLGFDIVRCPGDQEAASKHLRQLRQEYDTIILQATGKHASPVPWLIGVYPPWSVGGPEGKGGVFSYGYTPTLLGDIHTPRTEWERL